MINFGEIFFCEKVIHNPDGSPFSFVNRFSSVKVEIYPYLFGCTIVIDKIIHSEPLHHLISIRIRNPDGENIFESAPRPLISDSPTGSSREFGFFSQLPEIEIPEPGRYTVEILLNDVVRHREFLSFT